MGADLPQTLGVVKVEVLGARTRRQTLEGAEVGEVMYQSLAMEVEVGQKY